MLTVHQRYIDGRTDGETDGGTIYDSNTALAVRANIAVKIGPRLPKLSQKDCGTCYGPQCMIILR